MKSKKKLAQNKVAEMNALKREFRRHSRLSSSEAALEDEIKRLKLQLKTIEGYYHHLSEVFEEYKTKVDASNK